MKGEGRGRLAWTALGCLVGVGLLVRLATQADGAATWGTIRAAGPLVLLGLAPFAFGVTADAWGLVVLLRALGHRVTLGQILPIRVASEALHISMPAGFVAAETATAVLMQSRLDVPLRDGLVATLARKWLVMRSHAAYIGVGAVAGFAALARISTRLGWGNGLPWIVLASALVPLALSSALGAGLLGRSTFARLHEALGRLPWPRLRAWLATHRHEAHATDAQSTRLRGARRATTHAALSFLAAWCCESLESALLLRLVGAEVELGAVFAIEAGLSLVRSAVVFAPSGLGVVDLGYASALPLLGVDAGGTPAFVLLKRAKETVWVVLGYALLAALRGRPSAAGAPAGEAAGATG